MTSREPLGAQETQNPPIHKKAGSRGSSFTPSEDEAIAEIMGPAPNSIVPSRPRFSWDAKSAPWTDGKGDQEEYFKAVKLRQAFNDALPDSNSNKIPTGLRAICLKFQLYGREKELCSGISDEQLLTTEGVKSIVDCIYQRDALSVVSEEFRSFNVLLNTRRGGNENMKNFESRFSAQVAKSNSISQITKLPECITALMLLSNPAIDDNQRVSVMAAAAPSDPALNIQSSNDLFLGAITYQSVASIVKQCDKSNQPGQAAPSNNMLTASSANTAGNSRSRGKNNGGKGRPTKEEYEALMMKYPCNRCGKYGHWKKNHNPDGSLPPHVKSVDSNSNSNASNAYTTKKKTMSFNMATFAGSSASTVESEMTGPLVDDGAPYSAIGLVELKLLQNQLDIPQTMNLEPIPDTLEGHSHWQYGTGEHASPTRRILGSVVLTVKSDSGRSVEIRHLVLQGSSQWVIGRNVTRKANIEHLNRNAIAFMADGEIDCISLIISGFLSYILLDRFTESGESNYVLQCVNGNTLKDKTWKEVKAIVDKIHKHVCGHANYTDFQILFERNDLWNDAVASYISQLIEKCTACRSTASPQPSRKVSISSLSTQFNEVVCVDHFYLDDVRLMHFMDLVTRYSAVYAVETANMEDAVAAFEACWVSQFWYPEALHGDKAFKASEFLSYIEELGITFRPVPPGRHSKNAIESKHRVIRSIYLRLKESAGTRHNAISAAYKAVSISNDLYGNDTMSAFELAKGFTKPVCSKPAGCAVPDDVIMAHEKIQARRKLAVMLKSKTVTEFPIRVGDLVEVFQHRQHEKRGKWSAPKPVLSVNFNARSVTVPGRAGKELTIALEDLRPALPEDSFAHAVQTGIDELDDLLCDIQAESNEVNDEPQNEELDVITNSASDNDADFSTESPNVELSVGDRVSVFWPDDNEYYPGVIQSANDDGYLNVQYDDGDSECLDMNKETWKLLQAGYANTKTVPTVVELAIYEVDVLSTMLEHFGNKSFLKHQAQGFEQFPLVNAYRKEEDTFLKTVQPVPCRTLAVQG